MRTQDGERGPSNVEKHQQKAKLAEDSNNQCPVEHEGRTFSDDGWAVKHEGMIVST